MLCGSGAENCTEQITFSLYATCASVVKEIPVGNPPMLDCIWYKFPQDTDRVCILSGFEINVNVAYTVGFEFESLWQPTNEKAIRIINRYFIN